MLILGRADVRDILTGRESQIIELVGATYRLHAQQRTRVPFSSFLRFPDDARNRIIALPAHVAGDAPATGIKWVSSFPGNLDLGLDRASAAILLNSQATGHPESLVEGAVISAKRTAASAALAAQLLCPGPPAGVTLFGCGVINLEVLRFLRVVLPGIAAVTLHDSDRARAEAFADRYARLLPDAVSIVDDPGRALAAHPLVSFATTAVRPHVGLTTCPPGTVVLHVSLRDVYVDAILAATNVVDDADHVCREQTSVHLAELTVGHRRFIAASIGQLLTSGTEDLVRDPDRRIVFSPFGLGALDIALAQYTHDEAVLRGLGTRLDGFLAEPSPSAAAAR